MRLAVGGNHCPAGHHTLMSCRAANPWDLVTLSKVRSKPVHLNVGQPVQVAHIVLPPWGSLNRATSEAATKSMGPGLVVRRVDKDQIVSHCRRVIHVSTMIYYMDAIACQEHPRSARRHFEQNLDAFQGNAAQRPAMQRTNSLKSSQQRRLAYRSVCLTVTNTKCLTDLASCSIILAQSETRCKQTSSVFVARKQSLGDSLCYATGQSL